MRLAAIAAALLLNLVPAFVPSAARAERVQWTGTFELAFADDCWYRAPTASGTVTISVRRYFDGELEILGSFGGRARIQRHVACGGSGTSYDLDAEVDYGSGFS